MIELYASGAPHPPLVEAYIDAQGNLWGMEPQPREGFEDLMQVVLEQVGECPNYQQRCAISFLVTMNGATAAYLFTKNPQPTPLQGYSVSQYL
ncbi:hypothetical protein [Rhizobium sp. Rhizsp82]|uniref:hypothetical protein n=1 Tax=Rhizobium sp. Rhizsp82 TaxID=3243057 RepID=UPI0039B631EF